MKKKSEIMGALKELTEKRLLTSEVEAIFEPYKDTIFPLVLSFVSAERSFGSQKDEKYNGGYKVLCLAENWDVEVALLFEPEDNHLVESFDSSQEFEANVRFIDYDSLYQRAIFGKLGSEVEATEEKEDPSVSITEPVPAPIEETTSALKEERIVPEKKVLVPEPEPEPEPEVPELITEKLQQSTGTTGEVWGWKPDSEEAQEIGGKQKVTDSDPPQMQTSVTEAVYEEEESYLYDEDSEEDLVDQASSETTGCSKGCMEKISATFYVVGGLLMLAGCSMDRGGGSQMFFGLILIGIGYVAQKSTPNQW